MTKEPDKDLVERAEKIRKSCEYGRSGGIKSHINNKDLVEDIARFAQEVRDEKLKNISREKFFPILVDLTDKLSNDWDIEVTFIAKQKVHRKARK